MSSLSELPDYIIKFEIFSRTSLTTFNAMRCANKEFDSLSYNPFLQSLRKENTNQFAGFLMQKSDTGLHRSTHKYAPGRGTPTLSVDFFPAESRILCCSENGLVVFKHICPTTQPVWQYHVAKPATSQVIAIPNPYSGFRTLNMAIVTLTTSPFRYKILRISKCFDMKTRHNGVVSPILLELFDSQSREWKEFEWVYLNCGVHPLTKQPIVVSGTVHVLFSDMTIFAFNMFSETVSCIVPPLLFGIIPDNNYLTSSQIFKYNRSLGFAQRATDNRWTFWVLQGGSRWTPMYNVMIPPLPDFLRMCYNDYRFFSENNVVDNAFELHYSLFVFKSDNEPVMLNGGD